MHFTCWNSSICIFHGMNRFQRCCMCLFYVCQVQGGSIFKFYLQDRKTEIRNSLAAPSLLDPLKLSFLDRNVKFCLFLRFELPDYSLKSLTIAPAFSLLFKAGLWFCNELFQSGNGKQVQYSEDLMRPNVLRQNFCI